MAYTNIDDPSAHFQAFLYTGNGANRTITLPGNSDLKFDMYWYKQRSNTGHHRMFDTSRGLSVELYPDLTAADSSATYFNNQQANSFDIIANDSATNTGSVTFANWQWKANGGTTASNTSGTITSTVQANQDAGFSIVTYTGTGANATVGHGLGVAPSAIIIKSRSNALPWVVWTAGMAGTTSVMELNTTGAEQTVSNYWYNGFSSTTFGLGSGTYSHNTNNATYVAYCFAEKQGYSKFGNYIGNGNADGPFAYTGFKPAFVIMKESSSAGGNWVMFDSARDPHNVTKHRLFPNLTNADNTTRNYIDLLSNGFKLRDTDADHNQSGQTMIYMAFAENPFVTSTGVPTTAR